jgi:hypothetical protein
MTDHKKSQKPKELTPLQETLRNLRRQVREQTVGSLKPQQQQLEQLFGLRDERGRRK